ncbi:putative aldo-keto reductase [Aspergillus aurantiobrunneus]
MASTREVCTTTFALNNGMRIPAVGLGTWQGSGNKTEKDKIRDSIVQALHAGYRLIDTAQYYFVEPVVGDAVRSSGIPRDEIAVLDALGLENVDIFLMHWPCAATPDNTRALRIHESPTFVETWKKMEACLGDRCRAIGVCNFTQKTLDRLLGQATITPVVNQVELHALNPNLQLVPYCHEKGIQVMGWSTMGGGAEYTPRASEILTNPLFQRIAAQHQCSTGVLALSWAVQRGTIVIPKSSSTQRIEKNIRLVTLDDAEVQEINEAHQTIGRLRIADHIQAMRREIDGQSTMLGWTPQDFGWEDEQGAWLT